VGAARFALHLEGRGGLAVHGVILFVPFSPRGAVHGKFVIASAGCDSVQSTHGLDLP
jgi:hypothetical protein